MAIVYAIAVVGDAAVRPAAVHDADGVAAFVEMREMFTQTIGALAEAVDKRDPFTAGTASTSRRSRSTSGG